MDDTQFVIKSNKENPDFDKDAFMKMSKKEQREFATKILEDQGAFVFMSDEMEDDKAPQVTLQVTPQVVEPQKVDLKVNTPEPDPFSSPTTEPDPFADDDDDFIIPTKIAEPLKVSTAKRK